jgi:hypothetical protein
MYYVKKNQGVNFSCLPFFAKYSTKLPYKSAYLSFGFMQHAKTKRATVAIKISFIFNDAADKNLESWS